MHRSNCISCQTVSGEFNPPGGILFDSDHWIYFCHHDPIHVAGQGFIVLKRHCESVAALSSEESADLGRMIQTVAAAVDNALKPEKIHFGLYGEGVKHLHVHVTPRTKRMAASHLRLSLVALLAGPLKQVGLYRRIPEEEILAAAASIRAALATHGESVG